MGSKIFAKDSKIQYTRENISNYFLGIIYANRNYNDEAFKYLKRVQSLKSKHYKFNIEFIRTLVLLEKFQQAFTFSKNTWTKNEFFFEADLLLGLDYFIKADYINAEKHFARLNKITRYNLFFDNFIGNVLIAWSKAAQGDKNDSFEFLKRAPDVYHNLIKTQNIFLQCYFDDEKTQKLFEELLQNKDYNFSRYNFFFSKLSIIQKQKNRSKKNN